MGCTNWLTLAYYIIGWLFRGSALMFICSLLHDLFKTRNSAQRAFVISPCLLIYFVSLQIIIIVPSSVYTFVTWTSSCTNTADPYIIFWTTIVSGSINSVNGVSLFFLTIERIIYVSRPQISEKQKFCFISITLISMLAGFIGNFVGFVQELPLLRKTSQCLEYACLFMKTGAVYYFYTRMCVGILNFFTGIVFILKLRQLYNQTDPDIHSHYKSARINKVALIVICLEFFLNFLPQPLALLIFYVLWHRGTVSVLFGVLPVSSYFELSGVTIGSIGGPYSFVLVSLDIFISSMIYSNNIKKAKRNDSVVIVTRSLTQQ